MKILEKRTKEIKLRKNFLPTLVITLTLWASLAGLIYFSDPNQTLALLAFFGVVFLAVFFTASIIFVNSRRGVLTAAVTTLFLILRYFGVGTILNLVLLVGLAVVVEFLVSRK